MYPVTDLSHVESVLLVNVVASQSKSEKTHPSLERLASLLFFFSNHMTMHSRSGTSPLLLAFSGSLSLPRLFDFAPTFLW